MEPKFKPNCRHFKCTLCCLSHMQSQSSEMFTGQLLDWLHFLKMKKWTHLEHTHMRKWAHCDWLSCTKTHLWLMTVWRQPLNTFHPSLKHKLFTAEVPKKKSSDLRPPRRHTFKGERVTSSMKGRYPSSPPPPPQGLNISDLCACTSHEGGGPFTNSTTPPPWVSQACTACAQASAPQTLRRAFSFFFSSPTPRLPLSWLTT